MEIIEPLPLIQSSEDFASKEHQIRISNDRYVAACGYTLLALTWALFFVTVNTLFKCWSWVIEPLKGYNGTDDLYNTAKSWCESADYVVISLWCIYVVAWWWALFSWVGIKLFRHSKGIQT